MKALVWTSAFVRTFKRVVRRQPKLQTSIEQTLRQLAEDPLCPVLHSHKLALRRFEWVAAPSFTRHELRIDGSSLSRVGNQQQSILSRSIEGTLAVWLP